MGIYINPDRESKEDWLEKWGLPIGGPTWTNNPKFLPVCLVFNNYFSAAAVAFDQEELKSLSDPEDFRIKRWYMVEVEKLREVSNLPSSFKTLN